MAEAYFGRLLTAMVTPFNEDGSVNCEAAADFAEWLLANGSDGLVVEGSTGEAATMFMDEKIAVLKAVVERVNGRAPVIVGAGTNCTASTIASSLEKHEISPIKVRFFTCLSMVQMAVGVMAKASPHT